MICIIALVVFGIMGIFSATHRKIAKEALDCVLKRITLRKCETGLDVRLKSAITGRLMNWPKIAGFLHKYFEVLSWVFTIIMIWSIVQSGFSTYNYVKYGNCNGPVDSGFCIFDPLGTANEFSSCGIDTQISNIDRLIVPKNISRYPAYGKIGSKVTVIELACFACPYSKEASKDVQELLKNYKDQIEFRFINFPITSHPFAYESAIAAECVYVQNQKEYWRYIFMLFDEKEINEFSIKYYAYGLYINYSQFETCYDNKETKEYVDKSIEYGKSLNVYGTPTIFINDVKLVGPKPYRQMKELVKEELKK